MLRTKLPTAKAIAGTKWYQVIVVIRQAQPPMISTVERMLHATISRTEDLYWEEDDLRRIKCTIKDRPTNNKDIDRGSIRDTLQYRAKNTTEQ